MASARERSNWRLAPVAVALAILCAGTHAGAQAIRRLEGRHLTLLTDLPPSPEIDRLPQEFDAAVPQWAEFFHVDPQRTADWRMTGCLMADRDRFRAAELLPPEIPEFRHGYSVGDQLWLDEQPSDYYRRHLLLHEGTHGFQQAFAGSSPPWFQEGIAEMLATHRLDERGQVVLADFPKRKEDVPRWGRIALVRDAIASGKRYSIADIVGMTSDAHQNDEAYGWCWALAVFLDRQPRYSAALRESARDLAALQKLQQAAADDPALRWPWRQFVSSLEFGYDLERAAVEPPPAEVREAVNAAVSVRADRGWQPTGLRLDAGQRYRLSAAGRFVVAKTDRDWISEPPGVSIRYVDGRPLGQLLAAVVDDAGQDQTWTIGSGDTIAPDRSGLLYLKINDSPAELADNEGEIKVDVRRE